MVKKWIGRAELQGFILVGSVSSAHLLANYRKHLANSEAIGSGHPSESLAGIGAIGGARSSASRFDASIERDRDFDLARPGQYSGILSSGLDIFCGIVGFLLFLSLVGRYRSRRSLRNDRERERQESERAERYRAIVEEQTELICRFDRDYHLTFVNDAYCRYFQRTPADLLGQDFTPLIPLEDRQRILDNLAGLDRERPTVGHEHRVIVSENEIRWLCWCNRAIFDKNGNIVEYQAVGRDITDRQAALGAIERLNAELEDRVSQRTARLEREIREREASETVLREKTEILRTILENIPIIIGFFDEYPNFVWVNREWERVLGWTIGEMRGRDMMAEFYPDPEIRNEVIEYMREAGDSWKTFPTRVRDGRTIATAWSNARLSDGRTIGIGQDVSERERMVASLRESEERFRLAIVHAPLPIILHAEDGEVLGINQVWTELTGYEPRELPTIDDWIAKAYGNRQEIPRSVIDRLYRTEGKTNEGQFIIQIKNGARRVWDFSSAPLGKTPDGRRVVLSMALDVTDRVLAEERALYDARHDSLTGLPNRVLLMERVEEAIERARQQPDYLFAILFIDLDRFKVVNDSLGHLVGDRLLVAIAQRLQTRLRNTDTIARLGGDEFIVLADNLNETGEAIALAENLCRELNSPFVIGGQEFLVSASIGIAFNTDSRQSGTDLLRNADLAMYEAKARGKARHAIFHPALHRKASRLWELETNLRLALERLQAGPSEFVLHYQPIICLNEGKLVGFEALARWFHPRQGTISPVEFIPIAEETGLIVPLGRWILQEACQQLKQWQERFGLARSVRVSVNLSGAQLQRADLPLGIDRVLEETGLDSACLNLEITESILMENTDIAIEMLSRFRERQIGISIDDFGTGYSSLSYLHRLPVDTLKIDRSFVGRMNEDRENQAIVEAVIGLAHHLGVKVVAEGIETKAHLDRLKSLRCEFGQGYLFSKPLDRSGIENYLQQETVGWISEAVSTGNRRP